MSIFLYGIGAISVLAGLAMTWFGITIELSFGNALVTAGTTAVIGGLVVVALGAVVSRLQQIIDAGSHAIAQPLRPLESFETPVAGRPAAGRIPFPPKPKLEPREPAPAVRPVVSRPLQDEPAASFAPSLPNPDEPPVTVAEDVSLSPPQPAAPSHASADRGAMHDEPAVSPSEKDALEWRPSEPPPVEEHRGAFSFIWPADRKAEKAPPAAKDEPPPMEAEAQEPAPEPGAPAPRSEPPASVAVLKSGVVDGMGYTLYVDGSIEAELPQGTLRFASIHELRQHLEQNT